VLGQFFENLEGGEEFFGLLFRKARRRGHRIIPSMSFSAHILKAPGLQFKPGQ
jgi:hypothetical protein